MVGVEAENLNVDLVLMNIPSESSAAQTEGYWDEIISNIFNSSIPVIPLIDLKGKADFLPVPKDVLAQAPYGFILKNDSEPYNLSQLKHMIDIALYKHSNVPDQALDKNFFISGKDNLNLYDELPLPFQSLDADGNLLEVNQMWQDILGYSHEEVTGKWFGDFLTPNYVDTFKKEFPQAINTGKIQVMELELIKKDGSTFPALYHCNVKYGKEGSFNSLQGILQDINLTCKTEEAVTESEKKFHTFVQQSLDGIVLVDEEGYIIEWNPEHERITGLKKEEVIGKLFWEIEYQLTPPPQRTLQRLKHLMKLQLNAHKTGQASFLNQIIETDLVRADGEIRHIEQVAFPIKTRLGYKVGYVTRDITPRKQIEEALEKRIVALSQPLPNGEGVHFQDLFNLRDIQEIQDLFAEATGVGSIITQPDGTPITKPSNLTSLCSMVRGTAKGAQNCFRSNSGVSENNSEDILIRKCFSSGLLESVASINVGGIHIANWIIGQVRNEVPTQDEIINYADKLGLNPENCVRAFNEVPLMSTADFRKIAHALYALANQLSSLAYQNIQQTRFIRERQKAENALQRSLQEEEIINQVVSQFVGASQTSEIYQIIGETIKKLLPNSYVVISSIDPDKKSVNILKTFGLENYQQEIEHILKIDQLPNNLSLDKGFIPELDDFFTDHITESTPEIYNLFFKKISPKVFRMIERLLDVGKCFNIGFYWNKEHYGGLTIALPKNQDLEHKKTIETIVNQASIALQRSYAEEAIKESLGEKEVLLREIHHRVKNNMQIISSLLNLQRQYASLEETRDILKESQGRVQSMAMIHENLYQSPHLNRIDFKDYIEKLVSNLIYTYKIENRDIERVFEVKNVEMNIDTAIPCGLIINELITNSLKYAFPPSIHKEKGIIKIKLIQTDNRFQLEISDNGVGLPSNIEPENAETLGLQLVHTLVSQLEGCLRIDRSLGTKFTITFQELNYKKRI
ncbi:MAG: hypothetical protein PWQ15_1382 [Methanobacterium sp.]|jgi:PAS domain S-box-containing protein|nr:PocR ligand-binding domain-containing protein [Methanobacterium sp.]MDI3550279.1 hypothetical protein [Methanobacterium sp.]